MILALLFVAETQALVLLAGWRNHCNFLSSSGVKSLNSSIGILIIGCHETRPCVNQVIGGLNMFSRLPGKVNVLVKNS